MADGNPQADDADGHLTEASNECCKTENVDITLMYSSCKKCAELVENLKLLDTDPVRQEGLAELSSALSSHQEVLSAKISQLDGTAVSKLASTSTPQVYNGATALLSPANVSGAENEGRRIVAIQDTIIPKGHVSFNDVAGLHEAKQSLREAIILPSVHPHIFTGGRKPWRRILLYGPPGTGKSRLAQAVSSEIQSTFYCVSSSDLVSSWVGESEKLIKDLFAHASKKPGTSVIFIDEVDSICRQRSSREEEHTRRIKTELLTQMEGAISSNNDLFLLCATNCPWELDSAFLRRFQKRIYIPLPDKEARLALMAIHTREDAVTLSPEQWEDLANRTEGYSGSDIANMVLGALFVPIRHMQQATHWKHVTGGHLVPCSPTEYGAIQTRISNLPPDKVQPRDVCIDDFLISLQTHSNTVSVQELARFEEFTQSFGQQG